MQKWKAELLHPPRPGLLICWPHPFQFEATSVLAAKRQATRWLGEFLAWKVLGDTPPWCGKWIEITGQKKDSEFKKWCGDVPMSEFISVNTRGFERPLKGGCRLLLELLEVDTCET